MLKIKGLSAGYGEFGVLHDISLEMPVGETVVLVGPNGAGKSTLLKVISGVLTPTAGAIYLNGHRIDGKKPHEVVEMGISIVPEGGRLFPDLSVYDNLKMGAYSPKARKQFKVMLQEVARLFPILKERQGQTAGLMSGGERQMVAIARTLMSQPKLIILDEPSAGLAPKVVASVFKFVREIKAQGYSILMVEQNARQALELADHAYLIEAGRLQFHGEKEDFVKNSHIKRAYLGI